MNKIVEYIKSFLLYGDTTAATQVGYTADTTQWSRYRVVIVPCGHLGTDLVIPDFAHPEVERVGDTLVVHTDLIYNTFFFISRAEELLCADRDEHGRFTARNSVLGQDNRLLIPIVDEYARFLMKLLDLPLPDAGFSHIYLTHDVDTIEHFRHLRGAVGGILRGQRQQVRAALRNLHNDPAYTFPWLIAQDRLLHDATRIYFIKYTRGRGYDYPQYNLQGRDYQHVANLLRRSGALLGLHSSYYGDLPTSDMDAALAPAIPDWRYHRSHYLRCSIDRMQRLADAGITDDFTMGFPDQIGFRLQTTRPVRFINPKTMTLTPLTLHPLTVMDCTLSNECYMHLSEDEAFFECERLFDKVHQNSGEIVLLWHNTSINPATYHRSLYPQLLTLLAQ